jgi:hypothetical protein
MQSSARRRAATSGAIQMSPKQRREPRRPEYESTRSVKGAAPPEEPLGRAPRAVAVSSFARSKRQSGQSGGPRPTQKGFERSIGWLLGLGERQRAIRLLVGASQLIGKCPRGRIVGTCVAREFVPKQNSEQGGNDGRPADQAARLQIVEEEDATLLRVAGLLLRLLNAGAGRRCPYGVRSEIRVGPRL